MRAVAAHAIAVHAITVHTMVVYLLSIHITALDEKGCWRYASSTCISICQWLHPAWAYVNGFTCLEEVYERKCTSERVQACI